MSRWWCCVGILVFFPFAEFFEFNHIGHFFLNVNRTFKVTPKHLTLIWVWILKNQLQNICFWFCLSFSTIQRWIFLCFVLLFCCRTQEYLSFRAQIDGRTEDCTRKSSEFVNYGKSSCSWSSKAAPDHHTTSTMFNCYYRVLFPCGAVLPDVTGLPMF